MQTIHNQPLFPEGLNTLTLTYHFDIQREKLLSTGYDCYSRVHTLPCILHKRNTMDKE